MSYSRTSVLRTDGGPVKRPVAGREQSPVNGHKRFPVAETKVGPSYVRADGPSDQDMCGCQWPAATVLLDLAVTVLLYLLQGIFKGGTDTIKHECKSPVRPPSPYMFQRPQLYIKNEAKKHKPTTPSDTFYKPQRTSFRGPMELPFPKKMRTGNRGRKRCRLYISLIKTDPKTTISVPYQATFEQKFRCRKTEPHGPPKTGLGHQKGTDFTYHTPIQPRLRRCGDETKGFGMHLKRNTDMTCFIHRQN